jgi:hypothetical protein
MAINTGTMKIHEMKSRILEATSITSDWGLSNFVPGGAMALKNLYGGQYPCSSI